MSGLVSFKCRVLSDGRTDVRTSEGKKISFDDAMYCLGAPRRCVQCGKHRPLTELDCDARCVSCAASKEPRKKKDPPK